MNGPLAPGLPATLSPATRALLPSVVDFMAADGASNDAFDAMALRLFEHQYMHNEPLRRFCQRRGLTPRRVASWKDIPAVPINAFKELTLSCEPPEACEGVFMTSGTTRADMRGRHHHPSFAAWDLSMRLNFSQHFMAGLPVDAEGRLPMAVLFPPASELPNSSLARYLSQAVRLFGSNGSGHFVSTGGMDAEGLLAWLRRVQDDGRPVAVMGASYGFVHLLDALAERGLSFALPAGSRLLDTGGYKRQSREVPLDAFYDHLAQALGVPRAQCINMYGMTELSSQFYDAGNAAVPSVKRGPHWVRARVVDPLTGVEVPPGQVGVLVHCDLASFNSTTTILTEDLGVAVDGGFLLLGRVEGAQARGCSLAVEEFLRGAGAGADAGAGAGAGNAA